MGRASRTKKTNSNDEGTPPEVEAAVAATTDLLLPKVVAPRDDFGSSRSDTGFAGSARARTKSERWRGIILALLVTAVAFGVYAQTLTYGFTWDDNWLIIDNSRITDPTYVRYMLFERDRLWRPLKRMSFMLDYWLWGRNRVESPTGLMDRLTGATGFHLTNVLLQTGVCLALYALIHRIGLRRETAAATAILFAVHPIHVEAVANISHRKEPMSLLFLLLSFLAYLRLRHEPVRCGPIVGLYRRLNPHDRKGTVVLAIMAAGFLGAFLGWGRLVSSDATRAVVAHWSLAAMMAGLGVVAALGVTIATAARVELFGWVGFLYLAGMLSKEVGAVMLPFLILVYELFVRDLWTQVVAFVKQPDSAVRRLPREVLFLVGAIAPVLVLFTTSGYLGRLPKYFAVDKYEWISESQVHTYPPIFMSTLKSLAVSLKLLVWPDPLYLDRKFQVVTGSDPGALAGLLVAAMFIAGLVWSARRARYLFFALAWIVLTTLPVTNFIPLTHWWVADRFLYVSSVGFALLVALALEAVANGRLQVSVLNSGGQRILATASFMLIVLAWTGLTLKQNMVWRNSSTLWEHTLKYNERSYRALHGYGLELANAGEKVKAQEYYRRSIEVNPSYPEPRYALALLKLELGEYDEAIKLAEAHARLKPSDPETYMVIGNAQFGLQDYSAASRAYKRAVEQSPDHTNALFNLANVATAVGKHEEALVAIDGALKNKRDDEFSYLRGRILQKLKRDDEALQMYVEASSLDSGDVDPLNAAAEIYIRRKDYTEALKFLARSLALKPDQTRVQQIYTRIGERASADGTSIDGTLEWPPRPGS